MTVIDETVLRTLLREAAEECQVTTDAIGEIMMKVRAPSGDARKPVVQDRSPDETGEVEGGGFEVDEDDGTAFGGHRRSRGSLVFRVAAVFVVLALLAGMGGILVYNLNKSVTSGAKRTASPSYTTAVGTGRHTAAGLPSHGASVPARGPAHGQTAPPAPQHFPTNPITGTAKVQQSGTLGLQVPSNRISSTVDALVNLAGSNGGFVTASSVAKSGTTTGTPSGSITLDVPQTKFNAVLADAKRDGSVQSVSTKSVDETGKYVDLQNQISSLQASRQQYLTIMTQATSISDILAVQAQLNSIETQIEQLQGQLNLLNSQTSYATLKVTVTGTAPVAKPAPGKESGFVSAVKASIHDFVAASEGAVRLVGPILFALLAVVLVSFVGRFSIRAYRRRSL